MLAFRARAQGLKGGGSVRIASLYFIFPIPNPAKPEPKIFVHYSPVIPAEAGIQ
uniref:Uncharacterized protein n=1 Tax=Candidatus Kentrum sp. UNK TaxID=2126344 RepID=A0A451AP84_9GAMM|nr:MAG: hypothetical protein BECKUNK1418G_GA0071005_11672 [Candidatus Kentron sp. UNK]VFK69150.1 MAG: hypothetical protein BECKUNK1418H_GA0071006_10112 [Candidatus Kentron sp. UNK]